MPQYKTSQTTTDRRQTTDRRRQTTHCTIGSTDSTVGQKPWVRPVWRRTPLFCVTILETLCIKGLTVPANPCVSTGTSQTLRQRDTAVLAARYVTTTSFPSFTARLNICMTQSQADRRLKVRQTALRCLIRCERPSRPTRLP